MNTIKKLPGFVAVLVIASSVGTVYAEQGDVTQTRANERVRTEFNMQVPDSESAQSRNREEHMVMNKNQNQNQYQYQHQYRHNIQETNAGSGNAVMERSSWQSNTATNNAAANPAMQRSSFAGSMNPQSTAGRSMGGGRR